MEYGRAIITKNIVSISTAWNIIKEYGSHYSTRDDSYAYLLTALA